MASRTTSEEHSIIFYGHLHNQIEHQKRVTAKVEINMKEQIKAIQDENAKLREENELLKRNRPQDESLYRVIHTLGEKIKLLESRQEPPIEINQNKASLNNKIKKLKKTINEKNSTCASLEGALQYKQSVIDDLEQNARLYNLIINENKKEILSLKQQLENEISENKKKLVEYDQLNDINNATIESLQLVSSKQGLIQCEYDRQIDILQLRIDDLQQERNASNRRLSELERENKSLSLSIQDALKKKSQCEKLLDKAENEITLLNQSIQQYESKNKTLLSSNKQLEKTLSEKEVQIKKDTTKQAEQNRRDLTKQAEQSSSKQSKKKANNDDSILLQYQISSMEETIKKLEQDKVKLEQEKKKLEQEKTKLADKLLDMNSPHHYTLDKIEAMQNHINSIEETLGNVSYYLRDVKADMDSGRERSLPIIYQDIESLLKQSEALYLVTDGNISINFYNKIIGI